MVAWAKRICSNSMFDCITAESRKVLQDMTHNVRGVWGRTVRYEKWPHIQTHKWKTHRMPNNLYYLLVDLDVTVFSFFICCPFIPWKCSTKQIGYNQWKIIEINPLSPHDNLSGQSGIHTQPVLLLLTSPNCHWYNDMMVRFLSLSFSKSLGMLILIKCK